MKNPTTNRSGPFLKWTLFALPAVLVLSLWVWTHFESSTLDFTSGTAFALFQFGEGDGDAMIFLNFSAELQDLLRTSNWSADFSSAPYRSPESLDFAGFDVPADPFSRLQPNLSVTITGSRPRVEWTSARPRSILRVSTPFWLIFSLSLAPLISIVIRSCRSQSFEPDA